MKSRPPGGEPAAGPRRVTADAAHTMSAALETIARLNAVPQHRRSWRHGSIAWRRAYLERIVDRPRSALAIDRQVLWIKAASALVLLAAAGFGVWHALPIFGG